MGAYTILLCQMLLTDGRHPISILLEELGVPYNLKYISFDKKEQKTPEFLKLNPNGRIPARLFCSFKSRAKGRQVIIDHKNNDFPVFETIAILLCMPSLSFQVGVSISARPCRQV